MPDFRAHWTAAAAEPAEITLSPEESHHLVSVHRAAAGSPVIVFDGRGREWTAELLSADRRAARLRVRASRQAPPLPYAVALAQALPKGDGMDAIVRKATELGATRLYPVQAARTQGRLDAERGSRKAEKWRAAAVEAAKQCGNPWLPEIEPVQDLDAFLDRLAAEAAAPELRLVASLEPAAGRVEEALAAYQAAHGQAPKSALWLIGPEGDFTAEERNRARRARFVPVTLGPLVLRCETAAVCALAVLAHELSRR